jgi:hypothetical protein
MQKVILKNFLGKTNRGHHSTLYHLYDDGRKSNRRTIYIPKKVEKEFKVIQNRNTACFAGLNKERTKYPKLAKKMCFSIKDDSASTILTPEERYAWLKLAKAIKGLPSYVNIKNIVKEKKFVLDLTAHTNNEIYIYLCNVRNMVAEPAHALSVLKLIEEYGLDYYTATLIASQLYMSNSNHHF